MIKSAAELLEAIKQYELEIMVREDKEFNHPGVIGGSYERLTQKLLNESIFDGLNLRIVRNSFVYNDNGEQSKEIDCMLVVGEGQQKLNSDSYRYHIRDVIAVIQVKKTLYGNDILSAHQNLKSVVAVNQPEDMEDGSFRIFRDAYKRLTSKELPTEERRARFTDREKITYAFTMMEAVLPLRIVIGYFGFKDEFALREGFINQIENITRETGYARGLSPISFPNLIICGDYSIIKNNGMPFGYPHSNMDFYWTVLFSDNKNPMHHLLEIIWSRLAYKFKISSDIFDDDGLIQLHPLLHCKEKIIDGVGWAWESFYHELTEKQLAIVPEKERWMPYELNEVETHFIELLLAKNEIHIKSDKDFLNFLKVENASLEYVTKGLLAAQIIYCDEDVLSFLVDDLMMHSDGDKWFVGENKNGEMLKYFLG